MTDRVTKASLTIRRYRTYRRNFVVYDENGDLADLSGYTGRVQFKASLTAAYFFQGTTEDGVLQIDTGTSTVGLEIPSDEAGAFTANTAFWDIELIDNADRRIPLVEGSVQILDVVTYTAA